MVVAIEGVGPVRLERSARARRLSISLQPFRGARVAVPRRYSFDEASHFAHAMRRWLTAQQPRVQALERLQRPHVVPVPVDRAEATRQLTTRLHVLATQYGFTYRGVRIRAQQTLWGSCTPANVISLNAKLLQLPSELIDYVLLHELTHTRVKHHGRTFWAELARHVAEPRALARELRRYPLQMW